MLLTPRDVRQLTKDVGLSQQKQDEVARILKDDGEYVILKVLSTLKSIYYPILYSFSMKIMSEIVVEN